MLNSRPSNYPGVKLTGDEDEEYTLAYFFKHYTLELEKEFETNGKPATWANGGSQLWSDEQHSIALENVEWMKGSWYPGRSMTVSPDRKFLAATNNAAIHLYDVQSRKLVSKLDGPNENIEKMHFSPVTYAEGKKGYKYILTAHDKAGWDRGHVYIWYLTASGGLAPNCIPPFVDALANRAVRTISRDPAGTLSQAEAAQNAKPAPIFKAQFPLVGHSNPISHDGKKILLMVNNYSKYSHDEPPPLARLPAIVVCNLDDLKETWRLVGHDDMISWADWAPDDARIAEACWDETCGIWSLSTTNPFDPKNHLIGPTGNQNLAGAFSPDGAHVSRTHRPAKR